MTLVRAELLLSPAGEKAGNSGHVSRILVSAVTLNFILLSHPIESKPLVHESLLSEVIPFSAHNLLIKL